MFYVVLGGADFGAGLWQLTAGRGEAAERIRDHAHHSMGPRLLPRFVAAAQRRLVVDHVRFGVEGFAAGTAPPRETEFRGSDRRPARVRLNFCAILASIMLPIAERDCFGRPFATERGVADLRADAQQGARARRLADSFRLRTRGGERLPLRPVGAMALRIREASSFRSVVICLRSREESCVRRKVASARSRCAAASALRRGQRVRARISRRGQSSSVRRGPSFRSRR